MTTHLYKTNIICGNCVAQVTPFLDAITEVEEWSVDLTNPDRLLQVAFSQDQSSKVVEAIHNAGFEIEMVS